MDFVFDRQSFYKMNAEEMFDCLVNVCIEKKFFCIKREDLLAIVNDFQLGRRGVSPYDLLSRLNELREKDLVSKCNDPNFCTNEAIKHERQIWERVFKTNVREAKQYQDWFLESNEKVKQECIKKNMKPLIDYDKLTQAYFDFKKEWFKTHTIDR